MSKRPRAAARHSDAVEAQPVRHYRAWAGIVSLLAGGLALSAATAYAQSVRTDFFITNGQVTAQVIRGNTLFVGGSFSFVGPVTGAGVPVDPVTAVPAAGFPRVNGTVVAAIPDGTGGWFIGGQFTTVGGVARTNLAHILADQSVAFWNPGTSGIVRSLLLRSGVLYVGGDFTTLGGIARNRIGAVDPNTGVTSSWNPNANSSVRVFVESASGLYVGGQFTTIGGQARNRIARLNFTTGAADAGWNPNANSLVLTMWLDSGANLLYVGGQFTAVGGQTRNRIASLDATTGAASGWNPNANNQVLSIVVDGTTAYAAGQFTIIGGESRNRLAALDTSTGLATSWNPNVGNLVQTMALLGTSLYVGGDFLTVGGQGRSRVAAVDVGTGLPTAWNPSAFSTVTVITAGGGQLFVGGSFNGIGGTARNNLAAFDVVSGQVTSWDANANNQVQALLASPNALYVGGNFTQVGGQIRNNIAALDLTNGRATSWDPNSDGQVSALAQSGNRIYAGGLFNQIGGQARVNLAALDASSGSALSWTADADNQVFVIDASTPTIYVGGNFLALNGTPRNFVGAVDALTGAVTPWNPDATGTVRAIAAACDRVYVGGFFTSIGGQSRNRLATLDVATGLASSWDPNANGPVFALVPAPGTVYVGGVLSTVGGLTRNRIAALDPQNGVVTSWNPNSNGTVRSIVLDGTQVYIGGAFSSMAGVPSGNLAVVTPNPSSTCPEITLTAPPLPAGVQGAAYAAAVSASGGTGTYCYAVSAGALPAGLVLDPATGQISGTASVAGIALFSVTATDVRGCNGTGSYTLTVTAAPAVDLVAANTSGLCVSPAQTCVNVPFELTRGDSVGLRALSVTFQLETARLQLCTPGFPAGSIQLGTWADTFPNRSLQVTDLGGGRYTVDVVLLGAPCGATGGGSAFTVDVSAVGPTGSGALTVTSVIARDCANGAVAAAPGPAGALPISSSVITLAPTTLPNGAPGTPYNQTITASGTSGPATFTISAGVLPPGVTLSPTGELTGTPTSGGTFGFTVRATEGGGCSASRAYSIEIACAAIALNPVFLPDGALGNPYTATLLAFNGIAPLTFTVTAGTLPAGLTLSAAGEISGTPTAAGLSTFTIGAIDAVGCTGARNYIIDIFAAPPVSNVAPQSSGLALSSANACVTVPVVYTRGESTPVRGLTVSFQLDATKLALCSSPGVSVQPGSWFGAFTNTHMQVTNDGGGAYTVDIALLGAPCGITTGGNLFTVDLKSAGPDGLGAFTVTRVKSRDCDNAAVPVLAGAPDSIRIQNTDITLAPTNLPNGAVGAPYSQAITAQSGLAPFTFSVSAGSLPAGLVLAADGTLSGTPAATGGFAFTVSVVDVGGVPGSRAYTMSVSCAPLAITPTTLPDAQVGVAYSQTLSGSGGASPYTFAVVEGNLPAGLALSSAGDLTGTPSAAGVAVLTLRVTDAFGCTGDEVYTLPVFVDPAISRVVAVTAGLCLSSTQTCVSVPFVYQRGDSVPASGSHVTFQLDPRFALCTPGSPALSIQPGDWLAGFPNQTMQIIDHGGGSYTVDQVLLGQPCGPTTGGVLFTVNVAAVGGDGAGDLTVTDVRIRDCSNAPLPCQPGAPAQLIVSQAAPPAITDLVSAQVTSGNGLGSLTRIALTWTTPAAGSVAIYRASFGGYPGYDNSGGTLPDSTVAPAAPWVEVSANATSGLLDVPPGRGFWHYVAFLADSCGNVSAVSNLTRGSLDYHLGDVSNGAVRGTGDNRVRLEDISLLGAHYGITGATLVTDSVAYLDVGPTVDGLVTGRPSTDNAIDFEDLMIFSTNFEVVSSPQASVRPAPPPAADAKGEAFELETPSLVTLGDEVTAALHLTASGAMQGFSVQLAWDGSVLQPLDAVGAGLLEGQGGVVFSPRGGAVDAALLGVRGQGISGSGPVATFRFLVLRDGETRLRIGSVIARNAVNRPLDPAGLSSALVTAIPTHTLMLAPSPNPALGASTLAFALASRGDADLSVYSVDGRRVRTLAHGPRDAGTYRITWRGEDDSGRAQAPGIYWARLTTPGHVFSRRIVFLR